MTDDLSSLSDDDIQRLSRLIESLEQSTFDFLQLEVGDLKVTIGKGSAPPQGAAPPSASIQPGPTPAATAVAPAAAPAKPAATPSAPQTTAAADGTIAINSPIMGMFYAQSEPGAPPFVTVGAEVREDTTVALIEVMKTFNAIPAGVRGTVVEVCAQNAQLVEFGQILFRVRPS